MTQRIDPTVSAPDLYRAVLQFDGKVGHSALDKPIQELVKVRASQVNGCAYCVDMHSKDARAGGESEQRLYALPVWRETPFFDDRERAALALAEALCQAPDHEAIAAARAEAEREFDEAEFSSLIFVIGLSRAWNSIGVGFEATVGQYEPAAAA